MRGILAEQDRKHAQHIDGIDITEEPASEARPSTIPTLTTGKGAEHVWRTLES